MTCDQHNIIYAADDSCPACDERERIIKLLEGDAGQQIMCLDCSQELIALIKGKQK